MFRLVELGEDRLDASQEVQARVGQRYCARGPDEKGDADLALQRRDRPRRGRLRNVQLTTGRGKASLAGDPRKQSQREEAVAHTAGGSMKVILADYSSLMEKSNSSPRKLERL